MFFGQQSNNKKYDIKCEIDPDFYKSITQVTKEIDADFELSAPMMFLKYFINADMELKFKNLEDFNRYLSKNDWMQSLLNFCNTPNSQIEE